MPASKGAIGPGQKYCHACASVLDARAGICPLCGVRQAATQPLAGKNKLVAALLAIFLGAIGAHKFYLGLPKQGVVYLIFFWTFIPAVIGIGEGLIYLSMSDSDFAAKFGSR